MDINNTGDNTMTEYKITYTSNVTGKPDTVFINENDAYEFEDGTETAHNICEVIELFEKISARYWGTFETRHCITNIEKIVIE